MADTSVRADSVHATIYNNLMFYDSYDAGRYVPGVIVGVIPYLYEMENLHCRTLYPEGSK